MRSWKTSEWTIPNTPESCLKNNYFLKCYLIILNKIKNYSPSILDFIALIKQKLHRPLWVFVHRETTLEPQQIFLLPFNDRLKFIFVWQHYLVKNSSYPHHIPDCSNLWSILVTNSYPHINLSFRFHKYDFLCGNLKVVEICKIKCFF